AAIRAANPKLRLCRRAGRHVSAPPGRRASRTWRHGRNGPGAGRRLHQFGMHRDRRARRPRLSLRPSLFESRPRATPHGAPPRPDHPRLPLPRSRVLTPLRSDLASTKIVNVGGAIGTITGDHLTAVTGKLGAPPAMIPLDLSVATSIGEKKLHFDVVNHPKLTPLLVAITAFNGLTQNAVYGEGTTLHLTGEIRLRGHTPVNIENTYAPDDALNPDGLPIAITVQNIFARL